MATNYKDQINILSRSILSIDEDHQESTSTLITSQTHDNISIYFDNYLYLAIDKLAMDFISTVKYLGDRNFGFFVRKLLIEVGITTPNISDLARSLPEFLKKNFETHQDQTLCDLALIDIMWAYGEYKEVLVSKGTLGLWQEVVEEKEISKVVDINKLEKVIIIEIDNERALTIETPKVQDVK